MKHNFTEAYERIKLVPITSEDAEKMRVLRNKNINRFFSSSEITAEGQRRWFEQYLITPNDYIFSAYLKELNIWVGAVSIYHVDMDQKTAEFGRIIIDKDAADEQGLGYDSTRAACNFAFSQLKMQSVYLEVYADNLPAVYTYIKAGFQEDSRTVDEKGKEIIHMSINK